MRATFRNVVGGHHALEAARKALQRVRTPWARAEARRAAAWAASRRGPAEALMPDRALRQEAQDVAAAIEASAAQILPSVGVAFGGGAHTALLYYLVRERRPAHVVETGVAAGWSSRAILEALDANRRGHLWSSDLPYLRQAESGAVIGCLVPEELRDRWTLRTDGDRANLPRLLAAMQGQVGLVHYDSDKSRAGRERAWRLVQPRLAPEAVLVMDDIHEDLFFADLTADAGARHAVIEGQRKDIGVLFT